MYVCTKNAIKEISNLYFLSGQITIFILICMTDLRLSSLSQQQTLSFQTSFNSTSCSEYPDWLWKLRTEREPPPLDDLDPNSFAYWRRLKKMNHKAFHRTAVLYGWHRRNMMRNDDHVEIFYEDWYYVLRHGNKKNVTSWENLRVFEKYNMISASSYARFLSCVVYMYAKF